MADAFRRDGSRRIELFIPFEHAGKKIEALDIAAPQLDHTLRWTRGEIPNPLTLLSGLTGQPEIVLRQLRYPDVDRVLVAFLGVLPESIRDSIAQRLFQTAEPEQPVAPVPIMMPEPEHDDAGFDLKGD